VPPNYSSTNLYWTPERAPLGNYLFLKKPEVPARKKTRPNPSTKTKLDPQAPPYTGDLKFPIITQEFPKK
jgi:hypothetical protein